MGLGVRINTRGMVAYGKLVDGFADQYDEAMRREVTSVTMETHAIINQAEPVFKGILTNSTKFKAPIVRGKGLIKSYEGHIFTNKVHGAVLEAGRRAGAKMPPRGPIRRWVRLLARRGKFDLGHPALRGAKGERKKVAKAAYLVARKISRNPEPGMGFFQKGWAHAQAVLPIRISKAIDHIIRRL